MSERHKKMLDIIMKTPYWSVFTLAELAELFEIYHLRIGTQGLDTLYAKYRKTNAFAPEL